MNRLYRLRVLLTLAHSCILYPDQRVGQIISNALAKWSAADSRDVYYVRDETLLYALSEYNKEAL